MSRFNLIDEKWIPVRFLDGTYDELGVRETLLRSQEIAAIEDPSPLVVAALHRFLLAVLYRALEGPTDIDQAMVLFKTGLPAEKITAYLEKWRDRFWLFDEKYPFGQIPTFKPKKWRAWASLAVEHNADTAKVLFDHTNEAEPGSISPAEAIRLLLATQTFAVSTGKSEISHTGTAPSAGSMMVIPIGLNLLDTLHFCLIPQNRMVMRADIPIWEKETESLEYLKTKIKVTDKKSGNEKDRTVEREATGVVDLYVWRTRSIVFKESCTGRVSHLGFASGVGYKESLDCDPMLVYTIKEIADKGVKDKVKKKFSVQFEEKGVWRDFDSLLPDDTGLAPKVIEHAAILTKKDQSRFPRGLLVLGQRYFPPRPNVVFWRKEFFALPEAISGDRNIRQEIHDLLVDAENGADVLNAACEAFAKDMIGHGIRKIEKTDVSDFVKQLSAPPCYWATLESRFHEILREYTLDKDSEDIRCQWLKFVRESLRLAWGLHSASVSTGDAWSLRALVKAEGLVRNKLKELNDEILKLESEKEEV
ncbi:MAG: type I-E CRISPR-associated protein Cse1/CasA [Pseudomonadota bacterium]